MAINTLQQFIFRMQFCEWINLCIIWKGDWKAFDIYFYGFFCSSQRSSSLLIGLIKLTVASRQFHSVKTRQVAADLSTFWKTVIYSYYLKIILLLITIWRTHSAFLMHSKLLVTWTMKIIIKGSSRSSGNCQKKQDRPHAAMHYECILWTTTTVFSHSK